MSDSQKKSSQNFLYLYPVNEITAAALFMALLEMSKDFFLVSLDRKKNCDAK